jgi:16S rRNA G1207 methylase RsmC
MNPPFSNGQDIDHVRHAFDLLADGGRLIAIMSEGTFYRSDKKAVNFRAWLDEHSGTSERLPE